MRLENKGITLIALVITMIVLLILAGVTINLTLGDNGIFKVAEQAARNYKDAEEQELGLLNKFTTELETNFEYSSSKGVNKPKVLTGMTPIKFTEPTTDSEGIVVVTNESDENWYSYTEKQWANTQTKDGSMWVWIPRYAYKINSTTQTCDVVFLIGTTDNYYDENGDLQTAKRTTSADEVVDTTTGYIVHPAFTNETSINYANGGWDEELTGIWIAKFEAGYAGGNNTAPKGVSSTVKYTQTKIYVGGTTEWGEARNWTDGEYGETITSIKYPTFQGMTYAMNYISIGDAYNISRVLTEDGNIYGLNRSDADSHLMKNSEWGAVVYLGKSRYGLNTENIYINNARLTGVADVYEITGCCSKIVDATQMLTSIEAINNRNTDVYVWSQLEGQKVSCTGTIYGVYDMSGGVWEFTAGYLANYNDNLKIYGESLSYNGNILKTLSTKYATVYPHDSTLDYVGTLTEIETIIKANYSKNTKIYGDAIRETSTSGIEHSSWYGDYSRFMSVENAFLIRGRSFYGDIPAGITAFAGTRGYPEHDHGFRSVLVAK